ncbi:MAG: hypothetical protein ACR2M0_00360 [Chloroflexia bacterium]
MSNSTHTESALASESQPRDAAHWAHDVATLKLPPVPDGAINLNVEGRRVLGPLQGFGQLWEKTYRVRLRGVAATPAQVVAMWKANFLAFASPILHFYLPPSGFLPGGVALINADVPGGMKVSTGVLVLYSDEESFSLMTPQGHMFAGWITFSAYSEGNCAVAEAKVLIRASDPLFEVVMRIGGSREEDKAWQGTLRALAAHFGVDEPVSTRISCLDPGVQWSRAGNIIYNAAIRSMLYTLASPFRKRRKRAAR